nr:unnamed protein product [Gossypium raimondii]
MAETFLLDIAQRVVEKIAHLSMEELGLAFNVQSDLRKLKETMSSIKAVLLDAERQQHQNEKLRLCMWKLRDIFYDAEDGVCWNSQFGNQRLSAETGAASIYCGFWF